MAVIFLLINWKLYLQKVVREGERGERGGREAGEGETEGEESIHEKIVKLYKLKEKQKIDTAEDNDEVARPDSSFASSSQAEITPTPSHNTTMVGEGEGEDGTREAKRGNSIRSPHKQRANELLRRNAETKEALRAKTSSLLQELSITKQLVQFDYFFIFIYLFLLQFFN
jgi:hypothetical protein